MLSLVSSKLAKSIGARKISSSSVTISGVGGEVYSPFQVEFSLRSLKSAKHTIIRANVVDKIPECQTIGQAPPLKELSEFQALDLSDPEYSSNSRIDVLLGVGYCAPCLLKGIMHSQDRTMVAMNTIFGWTLGGGYGPCSSDPQSTSTCLKVSPMHEDCEKLLQRFWHFEEPPCGDVALTAEELKALTHFKNTVRRQPDGRYMVSLPRRYPIPDLGKSRQMVLRRYLTNEKSLIKVGQWEAFHMGVQEYIDMDHAEPVPAARLSAPVEESFYLPMHGVVKESSTTTKLHVVFDGSAHSSTGVSLNDTLLPGPSLYPLLSTILNRFRMHPVALVGDISKMFREVGLVEEDRDLHHFLHKDDDRKIADFRMSRVTFGISSSQFLASQVLHQVADDYASVHPEAAKEIKQSFYVDDVLTGSQTVEQAVHLRQELNLLLGKGLMTLRKWRASHPELLNSIPTELQESALLDIKASHNSHAKTLGLHWDTEQDSFYISIPDISSSSVATKRTVTSMVARIFDVMGWFSPATLPAKLLIQKAWVLQMSWDEPLPEQLQHKWTKWLQQIPVLHQHSIKRFCSLSLDQIQSQTLHGFSDVSSMAYGGVVYLRTVSKDTTVMVQLLTAKSKLAPIKGQTIPRLELCGAQLLSKLLLQSARDLDIPNGFCICLVRFSSCVGLDEDSPWKTENLRFPPSTRLNQQDSIQ